MKTVVARKVDYKRIKASIEKAMRFTLKDIGDGALRVELLTILLKAREVLNGKESGPG